MNYKKVYDKIIQNRLENPLTSGEYGERHHIVPRSLGGINESSNLVKLTAREHFICHALLSEMYEIDSFEWYKMNHAFMMMKTKMKNHQRYFNSRLYELKRKDFSKVMSKFQTGKKNSQYGKIWIYNLQLKQSVKINKYDLNRYLSDGWEKGRIIRFVRKKKQYNKLVRYNGRPLSNRFLETVSVAFSITGKDSKQVVHDLRDLLYQRYVLENLSTVQIAKEYNLTNPTIRKYLLWLGIGTKSRAGTWKNSEYI